MGELLVSKLDVRRTSTLPSSLPFLTLPPPKHRHTNSLHKRASSRSTDGALRSH